MQLTFLGAAGEVTGSSYLIETGTIRFLVDCGMFQGMGKATIPLNNDLGFDASTVDVMVLSHAHIDHSGLIPKLVKEGYRGKIYCTPATKDLTGVLLEDSAHIQENDVRYVNKKRAAEGQPYVQPLYTLDDAKKATERLTEVKYNEWKTIEQGVELLFTDAGHIIGSACVHLRITDNGKTESLTFSGDIGRYRDIILRSPDIFPQADYIIMESTYGNSLHEMQFTTPNHLLEWVERTCVQKKGKLIIPAFSVGRTQEILFALNQLELENRLPKVDYFLDSPLSIEATDIIKSYPQYFNKTIQKVLEKDNDPFKFPGLKYIQSVDQSKMLNFRNEPCVIISASGMAEAGRVKHHISNNVENSRNAILMTGYCEPNSLGARLQTGAKEVGIFGVAHEVHAEIGAIRSMSAHGDYEDMSQWLACQNPKEVKRLFLVHGEYDVQQDFKSRLVKKGFVDVEIPELHYETGLS